jgi:hypothetical protein
MSTCRQKPMDSMRSARSYWQKGKNVVFCPMEVKMLSKITSQPIKSQSHCLRREDTSGHEILLTRPDFPTQAEISNVFDRNPSAIRRAIDPKSRPNVINRIVPPRGLAKCIEAINRPDFKIRDTNRICTDLDAIIRRDPANLDARLWRGILLRITGYDGRNDLDDVLHHRPENRLARINRAACAVSGARNMKKDLPEAKKMIVAYLEGHPDDGFAILVDILIDQELKLDLDSYISRLEQLYLKCPDFDAVIAVLSSVLMQVGLVSSALDYACEAYRKNPKNLLSYNIIQEIQSGGDSDTIHMSYGHCLDAVNSFSFCVFRSPYSQQDPFFEG